MSIYPDKKDGVVTGRWRVEVQLGGLCKLQVRRARWLTSPRSCGPKYVNRRSAPPGITVHVVSLAGDPIGWYKRTLIGREKVQYSAGFDRREPSSILTGSTILSR